MAKLKDRSAPPFRLVVLGDGEERGHLEALIDEKGLSRDIQLLGSVPYWDVPNYLALAKIFVYASASETQGMVILEAMAAGLPVVAVNSSGIDAFVTHRQTGLVTPQNVDLWTEALHGLLLDEATQRAMSRSAGKIASQYSVEAFAEGAAVVYQTALGSLSR